MLVYSPIIFSKSQIGFFSIRLMSAKETFLSVLRKQSCIHCGSLFPPPQIFTAGSKTLQWITKWVNGCCTRLATHTILSLSVKVSLQTWPQVSHNKSLRHLIFISTLIMAGSHKTSLRSSWVLPRTDAEPSNPFYSHSPCT